jgi:hypothetical protein
MDTENLMTLGTAANILEAIAGGGLPDIAKMSETASKLRVIIEAERKQIEFAKPCPDCPPGNGSWFGPCADGKHHRTSCPVGAKAMREAKWPCGRLRYPIQATMGPGGVPT